MSLDFVLLLTVVVCEATVLTLISRRGMWRRQPAFCVYMAWTLVWDVAMPLVQWRLSAEGLSRLYEVQVPIDWVAHFLVLVEVVLALWNRHQTTRSRRMEFLLVGMLFAGMLTLWPITQAFATDSPPLKLVLLQRFQVDLSLLFVVCWLALEGLRRQLSWSRRDPEVQILRGFGVYATVSLSTVLARHAFAIGGGTAVWLIDLLQTFNYLAVLIYWMFSLSRSRPKLEMKA